MAAMNQFQPSRTAKRARSALAASLRAIALAAACWLVAEWPALAAETKLPTLINAYRAAPQTCNGIRVGPLALDSPGHCANIMNAGFAEMGAAYAINQERGTLYWTQVFGSPR
jgi:hypothetical protein